MYWVVLRDGLTGEVGVFPQDHEWKDSLHFWWTDGNMSCDCNRGDFFLNDDDEYECNCNEIRFAAICAILPTGEVLELDNGLLPVWIQNKLSQKGSKNDG